MNPASTSWLLAASGHPFCPMLVLVSSAHRTRNASSGVELPLCFPLLVLVLRLPVLSLLGAGGLLALSLLLPLPLLPSLLLSLLLSLLRLLRVPPSAVRVRVRVLPVVSLSVGSKCTPLN